MKPLLQYGILMALLLQLFLPNNLAAQSGAENFNVDSELYNYYQRCKENIRDSIVLSMSDTLYRMAEKKGDTRMRAVALSTILDYFYYQNNEKKIKEHAEKVMKFAKETNQSKYYYFAWGQRLIRYYINQSRNTTALYEAEKMLKEAQKDNDEIGIATCYRCLSTIYFAKRQEEQALYYYLEEAKFTEKHNIENYNISLLYTSIALKYLRKEQPEEAFTWFRKADSTTNTTGHKFQVKLGYIQYYMAVNQSQKAFQILEEASAMIKKEKVLGKLYKNLYQAETDYYIKIKDYKNALISVNKSLDITRMSDESVLIDNKLVTKAEIFWLLNQKDSAALYYKEYIKVNDSITLINDEKNTGEFAALLNLEKLNSQNNELILKAQEQTLKERKIIISFLIIIMLVLILFIIREKKHIRQLKNSEKKLQHKNNELIISQAQLHKSKEKVEEASRMKTLFIQNMSHEIRTPLNAIVGFSKILTELNKNDDDLKEYSDIITNNSNDLLKLISDVLTISRLDSSDEEANLEETDINKCCLSCIESAKSLLHPRVYIDYLPDTSNSSIINTDKDKLTQIINNLLHNSVKFTESGRITLSYSISDNDKQIVFTISDTGSGIPIEMHEKVFDRFIKLDEFTQGNGLGLPICKLLVNKLKGTIHIDSTCLIGSRFIVTIPLDYKNI